MIIGPYYCSYYCCYWAHPSSISNQKSNIVATHYISNKLQVASWGSRVELLALLVVKFIYSEKATKFCEIFPLLLTTVHTVKSKGNISQNFVAFSEYMNFFYANLGMSCPMHVAKCTFPIQVPMSKSSECPIDILEIQFDFGNAKTMRTLKVKFSSEKRLTSQKRFGIPKMKLNFLRHWLGVQKFRSLDPKCIHKGNNFLRIQTSRRTRISAKLQYLKSSRPFRLLSNPSMYCNGM